MTTPRLIPCPNCGTPSPYTPTNEYRPFCSERCKMIDLGQWATETYRIPDHSPTDSELDGSDELQ